MRTCFRCGAEFKSGTGERICSACREASKLARDGKRPTPTLSFREKQVASLVVRAKLNKEIAHELHLTEGTVKEYLNRIFKKLGFSNRTELAVWAIRQAAD